MVMNTNKTTKRIAHAAIKTEKAETCFTRLYGRAAYESWKARDAALTELFKAGGHSKREICRLREDSFRQMKAEGARLAAEQAA